MNPQEFNWTEDQQVTVKNPTKETFKFKVHNKDYELGAGKEAKMPGYIAWVYVYGVASKLAQEADEFHRWNEEGFRQTYFAKAFVSADKLVSEVSEVDPVEVKEDTTDQAVTTEDKAAKTTAKK